MGSYNWPKEFVQKKESLSLVLKWKKILESVIITCRVYEV